MIKIKRRKYLFLLGLIWLVVGLLFVYLGVSYVCYSALITSFDPFINMFVKKVSVITRGFDLAAIFIICFGVLIGLLFGRNFISKCVKKDIDAICLYAPVLALFRGYSIRYWLILGSFIFLSLYMAYMRLSYDINGFVKIFIGSSLINGAFYYFKVAFFSKVKSL